MTSQDEQAGLPEPAESQPARPAPHRGVSMPLLLVALLPGLAALAWLGWGHWQARGHEPLQALDARIDALAARADGTDSRLADLAAAVDQAQARIDAIDIEPLQRELDAYQRDLAALERILEQRLRTFDDTLEALELGLPDIDRRVLLVESAALLRLGQDRLELAGDADGARRAYTRALERLNLSDDPRAGAVSRQAMRELEAIRAWQTPDWLALAARLRALSESVGDWPLRAAAEVRLDTPEQRRSLRGRMQRALDRLITVRRTGDDYLAPAEAEQLRASVRARLAIAELEVARRDGAALAAVLAPVEDALQTFFDADHARVIAASDSLSAVLDGLDSQPLPVLGEAARQLQSLLDRRG